MARTKREKLKELQTALEQVEQKAGEVEQKLNESQVFLDQISQYKTNAEQWRDEIETISTHRKDICRSRKWRHTTRHTKQ